MSQRNMYNCTACDSVFVVTVVETSEERQPTFCPICNSNTIIKIEASND